MNEIELQQDGARFNQLCMDAVQTAPEVSWSGLDLTLELALKDNPTKTEWVILKSHEIAQRAAKDLSELFGKGYVLKKGCLVLGRYLDSASKEAGAGYDYIPDEMDYNSTMVVFEKAKVRLDVAAETPESVARKVQDWFADLKSKYLI